MGHQHLHLPVRRRRRQRGGLASQGEILAEDTLEVADDRPGRQHVEVVIQARVRAPVDAAHDRLRPVDDQELDVVDGQALDRKRDHPDPALLELGPDGPAASLRRVLDAGDRDAAVVRVEQ